MDIKCDQCQNNGPLRIEMGEASDVGRVRHLNEDSLLTLEPLLEGAPSDMPSGLFAVADGIGGHEAGEIASDLALKTLERGIRKILLSAIKEANSAVFDEKYMLQALTNAVRLANSEVYAEGQARRNNMGTTLAAALVLGETAYIANVGDSRVYLLDGKHLRQVTKDHSLVAAMVEAGRITPEEVYTHPRRNIITRCLGPQKDVEVDLFVENLKPPGLLILCSDGLWEMVRDNEIRGIVLEAGNPQVACDQLTELANWNGGIDNVSVIIVGLTG
jgi:serine/threonine protein phosphatase PrpC